MPSVAKQTFWGGVGNTLAKGGTATGVNLIYGVAEGLHETAGTVAKSLGAIAGAAMRVFADPNLHPKTHALGDVLYTGAIAGAAQKGGEAIGSALRASQTQQTPQQTQQTQQTQQKPVEEEAKGQEEETPLPAENPRAAAIAAAEGLGQPAAA